MAKLTTKSREARSAGMFDPNYLSIEFGSRCSGYLRTPACDLTKLLAHLPEASSDRERGIKYAIMDCGRNPGRWERNRAPIKLRRSPEEAMGLLLWGDVA